MSNIAFVTHNLHFSQSCLQSSGARQPERLRTVKDYGLGDQSSISGAGNDFSIHHHDQTG
jgi:hypothetical protein